MPCFHPLSAFQATDGLVYFGSERKGRSAVRDLTLPCGRCVGCRLERSRQWAVRCMHESKLHKRNCFITLTYSDEHCPSDMSLDYSHFQKFMKRLRKRFAGQDVRFYMCGEYGEDFSRPHFHACIFGIDFDDKRVIAGNGANTLYTSDVLSKLWPFGHCWIGEVTFESAAYVARYIMKKVTGDLAESHYQAVDLSTGEIISRTPEFCHMSLKPGIGSGWLRRFKTDVYPRDYVVVRGKKSKPPRYYDKLLAKQDELAYDDIKTSRELAAYQSRDDNTPARLAAKEMCADSRLKTFKRSKL